MKNPFINLIAASLATMESIGAAAPNHPLNGLKAPGNNATMNTTTLLESREQDPRGPLCNIPGYQAAHKYYAYDAIQVLRSLKDTSGNPAQCTAGPGPRHCERVACEYVAAIWFCNDNAQPSTVACATLADYAQAVYDRCSYSRHKHDWTQGQLFDVGPGPGGSGGWGNVVVGYDAC
ncbi:hypothetical protein PG997_005289 [Apiospora hydei]|uniref:Secreted protein n=1 Tax=Apiospora hydei TaxID=1337664 RepID=A0ABR1X4L2_9PEZI